MDRIEYIKKREKALRFIYNNRNRDISTFLNSNDEWGLSTLIKLQIHIT